MGIALVADSAEGEVLAMVTIEQAKSTPKRGLLRRMLERPQQVWLRKATFQVHLWAGLLLGLYVIVIGISGSILVFKEELMPKPRIHIGAVDYGSCSVQQLTHAMAMANATSNGMKAFLASCPTPANSLLPSPFASSRDVHSRHPAEVDRQAVHLGRNLKNGRSMCIRIQVRLWATQIASPPGLSNCMSIS